VTMPMRPDEATPRTCPPAPSLRRAGRVLVACLAFAAAPVARGGGDVTGRADLTYADAGDTGAASEYVRQMYLLEYRRQLSEPTSYRLSLRYQDARGTSELGGVSRPLRTRILEPSGVFDHRLETFGLSLVYRRNEEDSVSPESGQPFSRAIARYGASVYVRPFEHAEANLGLDRLAFRSTDVDTRDDRLNLNFRYSNEELRFSSENRLQFFDDARRNLSRISMGPRITGSYSKSSGDRYSVSATYTVDYFRTEQKAEASVVEVELQPAAGLFGNDNLPVDTDPLAPAPGLIDRTFEASAGISLGPDGTSFDNVGVDMGRFDTADELRIHVRGGGGIPVPFGGTIAWTVYASADGVRWARLEGALAVFSESMSAYVVTFTPTTARYFKVVNFGVNTVDTLVTELQVFGHEAIRPNETLVSSVVRQGLAVLASGRPWSKLLVLYTARGNADALSPYRGPRRWSNDASSAVEARVGPFRDLTFGAGQAYAYVREATGLVQNSSTLSGSVRYRPMDRFEATLDGRRTDDWIERDAPLGTARASTSRLSLGTRVELYPSMRVQLSGGITAQDVSGFGTSRFANAAGLVWLDVHRDLRLGLEADLQRQVAGQNVAPVDLPVSIPRISTHALYTAQADYRPTMQLALTARVGYAVTEADEGLLQLYRAAWSPFPGGAVQLLFDYVEELDPLTGRSLRRLAVSPYWTVNRHTVLQLSYNMVRGTGSVPVRQENLYLTLSVRL
jgi:hypothetical protein